MLLIRKIAETPEELTGLIKAITRVNSDSLDNNQTAKLLAAIAGLLLRIARTL